MMISAISGKYENHVPVTTNQSMVPTSPLGASDRGGLHGMLFVVHDFVRGVEDRQDLAASHARTGDAEMFNEISVGKMAEFHHFTIQMLEFCHENCVVSPLFVERYHFYWDNVLSFMGI